MKPVRGNGRNEGDLKHWPKLTFGANSSDTALLQTAPCISLEEECSVQRTSADQRAGMQATSLYFTEAHQISSALRPDVK